MSPFPHRRFIRKRKRQPQAPIADYLRMKNGLPNAGAFVKSGATDNRQAKMNIHSFPPENLSELNVVNPTVTRHNDSVTENKTTTCANCEREVPALWESGGLADSGLFFDPNSLGYYSGFFDNLPPAEDGFCICHDCAVIFMKALPGLAKRLLPERGGHPMDDSYPNPPCCSWAWAWDEDEVCEKCGVTVLIGNDEGGWDRRKCECRKLEG